MFYPFILFFYTTVFQAFSLKTNNVIKPAIPVKESNKIKSNIKSESIIKNFSIKLATPTKNSNTTTKTKSKTHRKTTDHTQLATPTKSATHRKNKAKNKRSTASEETFSSWRKISLFSTPSNIIYESKNNYKMLLILQKEDGVPAEERKDITDFFRKAEEGKAIILSSSTIKNQETSSSRIKNKGETSLFYLEGSYIGPVGDQKMYYQEWRFYTNEDSIYIFVSLDETMKKEERKSTQTFIEEWLEFSAPFSMEEKEAVLSFIKNQEL